MILEDFWRVIVARLQREARNAPSWRRNIIMKDIEEFEDRMSLHLADLSTRSSPVRRKAYAMMSSAGPRTLHTVDDDPSDEETDDEEVEPRGNTVISPDTPAELRFPRSDRVHDQEENRDQDQDQDQIGDEETKEPSFPDEEPIFGPDLDEDLDEDELSLLRSIRAPMTGRIKPPSTPITSRSHPYLRVKSEPRPSENPPPRTSHSARTSPSDTGETAQISAIQRLRADVDKRQNELESIVFGLISPKPAPGEMPGLTQSRNGISDGDQSVGDNTEDETQPGPSPMTTRDAGGSDDENSTDSSSSNSSSSSSSDDSSSCPSLDDLEATQRFLVTNAQTAEEKQFSEAARHSA